jgi:tetratricopeptide (TPR) repeat protein
LDADPECYRVHDSMCRVGGVAHMHGATLAGVDVFTKHLTTRIKEMPNLPAPVRDAVAGPDFEPGVYGALRAAGPTDRGEPSWSALGEILQEVRFTQAWHRLIFMADHWGVETAGAAAAFKGLLDGHRLRPLIESFMFDPRRDPEEVRKRLTAAPLGDVDMKAREYFFRLQKVDPEGAQKWYQRANHGHGFLYPELARQARNFSEGSPEHRSQAKFLLSSSPHAPIAQALTAVYGGPEVVAKLGELEAKYAGHAIVQWGIGRRHVADKRTADAIRCWKRWVELSPSGDSFQQLAGQYRDSGDDDRWRATLEASLKEEDTGLYHAQARVDLARYYMKKKDFKRAEPYAMAAAESWAEWALLCAAECKEGLERWDEANKLYEAATDRYSHAGGHSAYTWYFACRATGKMDRTAAEAAVRGYLGRFGEGTTSGDLFLVGRFYLLVGEPKTARPLIDRANQLGPADLSLLFSALLADAAGDAKARTAALDAVAKLPAEKARVRAVATALRDWWATGVVPDAAAVDAAVGQLPAEFRGDAEFYFGWFLQNRKLNERAVVLWKRCLETSSGTQWVKTHARASLDSAGRKKD